METQEIDLREVYDDITWNPYSLGREYLDIALGPIEPQSDLTDLLTK